MILHHFYNITVMPGKWEDERLCAMELSSLLERFPPPGREGGAQTLGR